jgi:ABC-2 type transport system permease protein
VIGAAQSIFFARHEVRLLWRDWLAMMSARRRGQDRTVVAIVLVLVAGVHLIAYGMVAQFAQMTADADTLALLVVSGSILLSFSLMASQAMETVTRAFYARADLDLLLSSPMSASKTFSVRIVMIALSVTAMSLLLAGPFINVLAITGGARWLCAYGVIGAAGAAATAFALAVTLTLFRLVGAKRTRLVAQIIAAVTGAAFMIGLQVVAILYYGEMPRFAILKSETLLGHAPDLGSVFWLPARAVFGDGSALAIIAALALLMLAGAIAFLSGGFARYAGAAAGLSHQSAAPPLQWSQRYFTSSRQALRQKEWLLLLRDPWLLSQSLMQLLYLLPPALFLWRSLQEGSSALLVVVPVLVMAAGQLAGGLAWLAISGENAPDLIASAPIEPHAVIRAKVEAITSCIALVFAPFVVIFLYVSSFYALTAALGIVAAAGAAVLIQFWFRTQAKRSHFRRRQTSSRIATFAEASSSIAIAATAVLAAAETWFAVLAAVAAVCILVIVRWLRPSIEAVAMR